MVFVTGADQLIGRLQEIRFFRETLTNRFH